MHALPQLIIRLCDHAISNELSFLDETEVVDHKVSQFGLRILDSVLFIDFGTKDGITSVQNFSPPLSLRNVAVLSPIPASVQQQL